MKLVEKEGLNMEKSEEEALEITPIVQIGVVVKNLENAIEYYSKHFGLGPWRTVVSEHLPFAIVRGKKTTYTTKLGFTDLPGGLQLELIEVTKGTSIHLDYLNEKGEGIHHIAYRVKDVEQEIANYQKHGFEVLLQLFDSKGKPLNAYFDTDKVGGILFEVLGPQLSVRKAKEAPK